MSRVLSVFVALLLVVAQEAQAACTDEPLWQALVARARQVAEETCPCDTATDHASYVVCVQGSVDSTISQGLLPSTCGATVVSAASNSDCGLSGSVACCTPGLGGAPATCAVVSNALCASPSTVGVSESCYDACTPLPACASTWRTVEESETAGTAAINSILAAYPALDVYSGDFFRLVYHQMAIEQGCWRSHRALTFRPTANIPMPPLPLMASQSNAAVQPQSFVGPGPCADSDCLPTYDPMVAYCGPRDGYPWNFTCGSDCFNRVCYRHDGCVKEYCTHWACQFQGRNGDCDPCFYTTCQGCADQMVQDGYEESDLYPVSCMVSACGAAKALGALGNATGLCDPDFDNCACNAADCPHCTYCNGCPAGSAQGQCSLINTGIGSNVMHSAKVTRDDPYCTQGPQAGCLTLAPDCSASHRAGVRYYNCAGKWRDSCSGAYDSNLVCDVSCGTGPCNEAFGANAAWDDLRSCAATKGYPLVEGTPAFGTKIRFRGTEVCCLPPP